MLGNLNEVYAAAETLRREAATKHAASEGTTRTYLEGMIAGLAMVRDMLADDFGVDPVRAMQEVV